MTLPVRPNESLETIKRWSATIWASAVGADTDLDPGDGTGLVARRIVVGNPAGSLVLRNLSGQTVTFTRNQIYALGQVLDGQWTQIVASGSASYELKAGW